MRERPTSSFLHCKQCFTYPSPFHFLFSSSSTILLFSFLNFFIPSSTISQFLLFPSSISFSLLLHNFIISPPPPLPPHLFYLFFHPQYIDLLSTRHQPHIDPTSNPHRTHIDPTSTLHRPYIDPTSNLHRPHIDPRLNLFSRQLGK